MAIPRALAALALALALAGCARHDAPGAPREGGSAMSRSITEVLHDHAPELMRLPGVVGTGEGAREGKPVILVLAERDSPELAARVPKRIEGFAVEIRVVGEVRPLER